MNERKWYEIKNAGAASAEVWIYEQIGADFFSEGVSAKDFVREIAALKVTQLDVHINSPGGSVFDGQAIYNALRSHPAKVTSYVDGLAASIASVIALAADNVVMAGNALMMIHDPVGGAFGSSGDMRKMADILDTVAGTIAGVYVEKTGKPVDEVTAAMADETWFNAKEAVAFGLADEVAQPLDVAASFDLQALGFRKVPEQLLAQPQDSGRVLSSANEQKLKDARKLLDDVLSTVGSSNAATEAPTGSAEEPAGMAAEAATEERYVPGYGFLTFRKD